MKFWTKRGFALLALPVAAFTNIASAADPRSQGGVLECIYDQFLTPNPGAKFMPILPGVYNTPPFIRVAYSEDARHPLTVVGATDWFRISTGIPLEKEYYRIRKFKRGPRANSSAYLLILGDKNPDCHLSLNNCLATRADVEIDYHRYEDNSVSSGDLQKPPRQWLRDLIHCG